MLHDLSCPYIGMQSGALCLLGSLALFTESELWVPELTALQWANQTPRNRMTPPNGANGVAAACGPQAPLDHTLMLGPHAWAVRVP